MNLEEKIISEITGKFTIEAYQRMPIFALSCSVFYAKFYINVGIQILHNQIESCQALLPVNQFISIISAAVLCG